MYLSQLSKFWGPPQISENPPLIRLAFSPLHNPKIAISECQLRKLG
jgi:hypothetical protein